MNRTARAILVSALGLTLAAAALACARPAEEPAAVAAPDFSVTDLQGKTLTLADYKGKVLIINFWATWCPPCRREIPDFVEAYKELKGEGLEILGVSVDELTAPALVDWTKRVGINYPVALATPKIITDYEPGDYIPATIVIDRKGLIRYRQSSLMTKDVIVRLFRQYK
jgi:cytochrome c biogenesis protein CcmG/thiol:disulfide interchange protein DsbE